MKIDELLDLMDSDAVLDKNDLNRESLRITELHMKYYRIFMDEIRVLKTLDLKHAQTKKERLEYYMGQAEDDVYKAEPLHKKWLKSEVDVALSADEKLAEVEVKRDLQKQKVKMIEEYMKAIHNRSFNIRNAIEFDKFRNGII